MEQKTGVRASQTSFRNQVRNRFHSSRDAAPSVKGDLRCAPSRPSRRSFIFDFVFGPERPSRVSRALEAPRRLNAHDSSGNTPSHPLPREESQAQPRAPSETKDARLLGLGRLPRLVKKPAASYPSFRTSGANYFRICNLLSDKTLGCIVHCELLSKKYTCGSKYMTQVLAAQEKSNGNSPHVCGKSVKRS